MNLESLIVPLLLDAENYKKGLDDVQKRSGGVVNSLSKIGGGIVLGAVGAATAGIGALGLALKSGFEGAQEAQDAQAQLNAVLESTKGIAGVTADVANGLADAYERTTKFSAEATLAGESLLLTFTGIGKDVFPTVTETMLDMSQALGIDTTSAATMLGKALNSPTEGLTALTRVGVVFTEEQKEQVRALQESGDLIGAQNVLLQELQTEYGGSAEAAGSTFTGQIEIAKNAVGAITESMSGGLLPILQDLLTNFINLATSSGAQEFFTNLGERIGTFVTQVAEFIPQAIEKFQAIALWFQENKPIIIGALAALGVAVGVFVFTTVIPALLAAGTTFLATFGPAILIMGVVGVVVAALAKAWEENFMGIRDIVTDVWDNKLKPIFEKVKEWLATNIPVAIDKLKNWWDTVAIPAMQRVWDFIQSNIIPIFTDIKQWMDDNLPTAISTLSDYWNNTLYPALEAIWDFIETYLIPIFNDVADIAEIVLGLAIESLAGFWQNVLLPAITDVWTYFNDNILPILQDVYDMVSENLSPAIDWLEQVFDRLGRTLSTGVRNALTWVHTKIKELKDILARLDIPEWLIPGSPTPFELGLMGIGRALDDLNRYALPEFSANLDFGTTIPINTAVPRTEQNTQETREQKLFTDRDLRKLSRYIVEGIVKSQT